MMMISDYYKEDYVDDIDDDDDDDNFDDDADDDCNYEYDIKDMIMMVLIVSQVRTCDYSETNKALVINSICIFSGLC